MFKETLMSKFESLMSTGRWKFDEVALQAIDILRMCIGLLMVMVSVALQDILT